MVERKKENEYTIIVFFLVKDVKIFVGSIFGICDLGTYFSWLVNNNVDILA